MPENPQVLELLEEMLDLGKTPEEACRDCPDLLPEVRERWRQFRRLDAEVVALFPGIQTALNATPIPSLPHPDSLPRVPGYEVEALLGRGGMGVVYKAQHLALKRTVALKMLAVGNPYLAERARFRAEAEAVARLQHPNIVQIHEIGEADGRPFFALEYVAGGSLAERLAGQSLAPDDAARLVAVLAEAMHLAHSRNLVHRDLKPGNVLLAGAADTPVSQCHPKVTDFGLVRQLDADSGQTCDGVVMGTPSYMAPEQAEGRARSAGPAGDVYALGAILYECLTGRPPFQGATPLETLEQVRTREPAAPSSLNRQVPRDLETICLKCLRKEPERRYSSARELADDLGRFVRGEPVAARPVGRLERGAKWVRRNPTVAGLSAVAALALVAVTVVSLLFGVESSRKADELEKQAIELKKQTHAAEENAKEVKQTMVLGLLIALAGNPHKLASPLDATEADALRQLRAISPSLRVQFLETALREPSPAWRVGRRAEWVAQSIVGCDPDLRSEVARLVIRRIQEPSASQEVRFACARLGLALNVSDRAWAEHAADILFVTLRDSQVERDDFPVLAEELAAVCERLPTPQAADRAASALDIFLDRLQNSPDRILNYTALCQAIVAISPRLDTATAARAARELTTFTYKSICVVSLWDALSTTLVSICRRLPAPDAAAHINKVVDCLLDISYPTKDKARLDYIQLAKALCSLSGHLDSARAARVADTLIAILSDFQMVGNYKLEHISSSYAAAALALAAEHLDAPSALRAVAGLVLALRKAESLAFVVYKKELIAALIALCLRLDAVGLEGAAEALTAAARDPMTSFPARTIFVDAFAALVGRLTPERATAVETALVDSLLLGLADTKQPSLRGYMGEALVTIYERPGATRCTRAAEALGATIRDPQTPLRELKSLVEALTVVSRQLPPKDAATHIKQTLEVLDSLWEAKKAPLDRAAIAEALAAAWSRLDPTTAAVRAQRVAKYLEGFFIDPKATSNDIFYLAPALAAVYYHVGPAEGNGRSHTAADSLSAVLSNFSNNSAATNFNSQKLATLCAHLDRAGALLTADTLLALLDGPTVLPGASRPIPSVQIDFALAYGPVMKQVAFRLEERDLKRLLAHPLAAGRFQRVLLDVLAEKKKRSFRNTWEYLDSTESNGN